MFEKHSERSAFYIGPRATHNGSCAIVTGSCAFCFGPRATHKGSCANVSGSWKFYKGLLRRSYGPRSKSEWMNALVKGFYAIVNGSDALVVGLSAQIKEPERVFAG